MKILLVEDNELARRAFVRTLRNRGHSIEPAEHPDEAFQKLKEGFTPDIIISDWDMPGMNGGEFCKALRAAGNQVPFYIVSGRAEIARLTADIGATGVYTKPLSKSDIDQMLNS